MFIIPKILLINLTENCQTGPLIIVGPIVLAAAFALLCCSGEICARFRKDLGKWWQWWGCSWQLCSKILSTPTRIALLDSDLKNSSFNQDHDLARLLKQRKRVQDPSLLSTKNLHEVKHWVEPGVCFALVTLIRTNTNPSSDLVHYGWGQWDPDEETR